MGNKVIIEKYSRLEHPAHIDNIGGIKICQIK